MKKAYDEKVLWPIFSKYIRIRDAHPFDGLCKCFTCGFVTDWKRMDCGHGIPRQHKATKYNEKNNHAQCKRCNGFEGGKREIYKTEMNNRYGKNAWDIMKLKSMITCKMGKFEYDALAQHYKKEFERIKKEKNL